MVAAGFELVVFERGAGREDAGEGARLTSCPGPGRLHLVADGDLFFPAARTFGM